MLVTLIRFVSYILLGLGILVGIVCYLLTRLNNIPGRAIYTVATVLQPMRNRISDYYILKFNVGREVVQVVSPYLFYGYEKYHSHDKVPILYWFNRKGKPYCYIHDCEVVSVGEMLSETSYIFFAVSVLLIFLGFCVLTVSLYVELH